VEAFAPLRLSARNILAGLDAKKLRRRYSGNGAKRVAFATIHKLIYFCHDFNPQKCN
jgi:hypothetical protein